MMERVTRSSDVAHDELSVVSGERMSSVAQRTQPCQTLAAPVGGISSLLVLGFVDTCHCSSPMEHADTSIHLVAFLPFEEAAASWMLTCVSFLVQKYAQSHLMYPWGETVNGT